MRIVLTIIFVTIISFSFANSNEKEKSVYSYEVVYTFNYSNTKDGKTTMGKLYLGCLGKLWSIKEQKQFSIIWTTDEKELKDKIYNTGVIEDSTRIFLHPPRNNEFRMLEYSPFPYIKYPLVVGKSWKWNLTLGKFWENPELNVLALDTLRYIYKIESHKKEYFAFKNSLVDYYVISSHSITTKFDSRFTGYFNGVYGFIYCHFYNIDKSTITLELIDVCSFDKITTKSFLNSIANKPHFENQSSK